VRDLLAAAKVRPSKRLGQNFLVEPRVLTEIETAIVREAPETIVEIGPGLGVVTEILLRHAKRVIAIEVDRRLASLLGNRFRDAEKLSIIRDDVLRVDVASEIGAGAAYVVGNLPYRITAPILKWLIGHRDAFSGALLLTQREVAGKIEASPGKDGSALGVFVRAYAETESLCQVRRGCFYPVPEVDSTLWQLEFREQPRFQANEACFFKVVRTLYGTRRKMVRRALQGILSKDDIERVLKIARIDGTRRGEELSFEALDRLAGVLGLETDAQC